MISQIENIDCVKGMQKYPRKFFDLAIVDPPYGLGDRLSKGGGKMTNTPMAQLYQDKINENGGWDVLPSADYWKELFRVSKNQVVFGANYFIEHLHSSRGFIVWDKAQMMDTLSRCELAWTSFDFPAKIYEQRSNDNNRFHPTQKPIELYKYCINLCARKGDIILDTHLGSGSSRIAAHNLGFDFYGYEIDKEYFEKGQKRFEQETMQTSLF